jgi:hypothetical protein
MRIICAWCLQEGKVALLGEKMPFDDLRETHGICWAHQLALRVNGLNASRVCLPSPTE